MGVDFEERVNFERLRKERLAKAKAALETSKLGSLVCYDFDNIRYITSTTIGEWARNKITAIVFYPEGKNPFSSIQEPLPRRSLVPGLRTGHFLPLGP